MADPERKGWAGALRGVLERVASQQDSTAPPDRVVALPVDLNAIKKAIHRHNNLLVQLQAKRAQIDDAMDQLRREHAELIAENDEAQRRIIDEMESLQRQMISALQESGIRAEIVRPSVG